MFKGLCDFKGRKPIKVSCHPAKLGGQRHSGSGYIRVLVYHVTLQNHEIKALKYFMVRGVPQVMSPSFQDWWLWALC